MSTFIQLRHGRGRVIEPFLSRLYLESNPRRVFLVSPWITHLKFSTATTSKLLQKLQYHKVNLIAITRNPDLGSKHAEFIRDFQVLPNASVFFVPKLHAKFYIVETIERRYALLASANMYEWSNQSYEVGIVIEGRGPGESLVDELEQLAIDLRTSQ